MFKYYLLRVLRNRNYLFWCMVFPLMIMACMNAAFGNIYNVENSIDPIKTCVIAESDSYFATHFEELVNEFAKDTAEQRFFDLTGAGSVDKAKDLLLSNDAEILFVACEDDIEVFLSEEHTETAAFGVRSTASWGSR